MDRTPRLTSIFVVAVIFLVVASAPVVAGDEAAGVSGAPGSATFRGNAGRTGEQPGPGPVGAPVVRWSTAPPSSGLFTTSSPDWIVDHPAVAGGLVYLTYPAGLLSTLDAATGKRLRVVDLPESAGVPAVADGVVYVNGNGLQAVDAATGDLLWHFAAERKTNLMVTSSPAIVDGVVYFRGEDHVLYALDVATGAVRWQAMFDRLQPDPAVAEGSVYVVAGEGEGEARSVAVVALEAATGAVRWRAELDGLVETSPIVGDGVVYVSQREDGLVALDAASGAELWRLVPEDDLASTPATADGLVFVGSYDGLLYAVDAATGAERWRFAAAEEGRRIPAPSVADGVVYVGAEGLFAIDAATGVERWHFPTSSVGDAPVVVDGLVYLRTRYDGLVVLGDA